jgi:hypothetical protein
LACRGVRALRRNEVDAGSQPVRNIYLNPQFETPNGGPYTLRTNQCTNPGLEATGSAVTVRTNLHNGTVAPLGAGATLTTGVSYLGTTWTRVSVTTAGTGIRAMANAVDLVNGSAYQVEWEVANDTANAVVTNLDWCDTGFAAVTVYPGERKRIASAPGTKATYDSTYRFGDLALMGATDTLLVRAIFIEQYAIQGPYFDGSTSAISRTNLCHNPNLGGGSSLGYAVNPGGGTATGAYNSGAGWSGTGFYRATWTAASTGNPYLEYSRSNNPDILGPGRVYTFSGYIRSSAAVTVAASIGWANNLAQRISGQDGTGVVLTPDTWTRVSMTTNAAPAGTVGAWFDWKVTSGIIPIGGTLDVDGVLIEEGSKLGTFFDGATVVSGLTYAWTGTANLSYSTEVSNDFTYAWTGTANASTSTQSSVLPVGRQGLTVESVSWSSVARAWVGTRSAAVLVRKGVGDNVTIYYPTTEYAIGTGTGQITASRPFTWSVYVYVPTGSGAVQLVEAVSGTVGGFSTLNDQWQRISLTSTAPASGTVQLRLRSKGTMPAGAMVWVDGELIENTTNTALPYFDGGTAAAGDYSYNWTGTANASTSEQKSVLAAFATWGNGVSFQSSSWSVSGTKSLRIVPNNEFNTSSCILSGFTLEKGKTYTVLATRYLPAPLTGTLSGYAGTISSVQTGVGQFYSNVLPNVAGIGQARLTFRLDENATAWSTRLGHGGVNGSGDVYWDNIMIVEGNYQGDFINPTQNVLSKWDGTANNSTSVGYPPQFLDIAGKPELDLTAPSTVTVLPGGFGTTEARTFYTVYQNLADFPTVGGQDLMITYGDAAFNDTVPNNYITVRLEYVVGTDNRILTRRTGGGGQSRSDVKTTSANVLTWGVDSSGMMFLSQNNDTETNDNVAMSLPHDKIEIKPDTVYHKHVRTIMFRGKHNSTTRAAMQRYLGNKYGANVA